MALLDFTNVVPPFKSGSEANKIAADGLTNQVILWNKGLNNQRVLEDLATQDVETAQDITRAMGRSIVTDFFDTANATNSYAFQQWQEPDFSLPTGEIFCFDEATGRIVIRRRTGKLMHDITALDQVMITRKPHKELFICYYNLNAEVDKFSIAPKAQLLQRVFPDHTIRAIALTMRTNAGKFYRTFKQGLLWRKENLLLILSPSYNVVEQLRQDAIAQAQAHHSSKVTFLEDKLTAEQERDLHMIADHFNEEHQAVFSYLAAQVKDCIIACNNYLRAFVTQPIPQTAEGERFTTIMNRMREVFNYTHALPRHYFITPAFGFLHTLDAFEIPPSERFQAYKLLLTFPYTLSDNPHHITETDIFPHNLPHKYFSGLRTHLDYYLRKTGGRGLPHLERAIAQFNKIIDETLHSQRNEQFYQARRIAGSFETGSRK